MSSLSDRIKAIQETRARVWNEAQGFLDDLKGNEMNAEQRTQWDRYNERLDELEAEGTDLIARAEREQTSALVRDAQGVAFGTEPDEVNERQRLAQELRSWIRGEKRMATPDWETGQETNSYAANIRAVEMERTLARLGASPEEIRDLAWDTGSVASAVPTLFDRQLYEVLEETIAAFRMPTRRMNTASGAPMDFPKVTTHAAATQIAGQGTTFGGTDPGFDKITLTPVKYGQLIKLGNEVVTDTGVDIVSFVARDIGRAVGRRVNQAFMSDVTGSAFVGAAGTVATGGSLINPSVETLINAEFSINDEYRASGATGWLMRDSTAGTVRKLRDGAGGTEGGFLWQPSTDGGISGFRRPATLLGYPVFTDPNIASLASNAKIMYFGDWSSYYFRTVGSLMVERNDSVGFAEDQVYFRGKWRSASGAADVTAINLVKRSVS